VPAITLKSISTQAAEQIAQDMFGFEGVATQLAGEYDLNFAIKSAQAAGFSRSRTRMSA
jgi:hypothetical protein